MAETTGRFEGQVALVTGASTGLGRATALRLGSEGAAVAVNYARSQAEAESVCAAVEAAGGEALAVQADVGEPEAVAGMMQEVEHELGPVDVLVASAAVTEFVPFAELERLTVELWERIYRINVIGAFLCAQAVAPGMVERGGGSIVLVSSNSTVTGGGSSIPYVASKGALNALTRCLARTLAPSVRVNAVAPGWMLTPWVDKYLPPEVTQSLLASGRAVTDVEDAASAVVDVAANGAITGQIVVVDAGDDVAG
jgi:3-oxoacyl-[acyl-carrier protein] reductase